MNDEQRKHRYTVTFADGFRTVVEVRPDRLSRRLWDAFPKRMGKDAVTIVDETVAREWLGQ